MIKQTKKPRDIVIFILSYESMLLYGRKNYPMPIFLKFTPSVAVYSIISPTIRYNPLPHLIRSTEPQPNEFRISKTRVH